MNFRFSLSVQSRSRSLIFTISLPASITSYLSESESLSEINLCRHLFSRWRQKRMMMHMAGEITQNAVMNAHGRVYCGWYFDSQNLKKIGKHHNQMFSSWQFLSRFSTYSGDIMFATEAATIQDVIRHNFLVWPVVVVPAQFRPRRYDGLNVDICVPKTNATLFDHGEANWSGIINIIVVFLLCMNVLPQWCLLLDMECRKLHRYSQFQS